MAGRLTRSRMDDKPHKHDHFVLKTEVGIWLLMITVNLAVCFCMLGFDPVAELPLEVLSDGFSLAHMEAIKQRRSKRALKAVLLDQAYFPGVGNWMADEICWRLSRHPAVPLGELEAASVRRVSRMVCRGAMKYVADGNAEQYKEEAGFSPGNYVKRTPRQIGFFGIAGKRVGTVQNVEQCWSVGWLQRGQPHGVPVARFSSGSPCKEAVASEDL